MRTLNLPLYSRRCGPTGGSGKLSISSSICRRSSAQAKAVLAKKGTYKFTTRVGEDYMKGIKTTGPDNVLKLTVVVA